MLYITPDYYFNTYGGAPTGDDILLLIKKACEIIDIATNYSISKKGGVEAFNNDFIKNQIMLATAVQTDYLDRNGGLSSLDSSTPVQMTLGKFSYMNGAGTSERKSFPISSVTIGHLEATGLMYRGIN